MLKIALTGGIGTGKTYFSNLFRLMQFPVFNADQEGKNLYHTPEVISAVRALWGDALILNGEVDLEKLSRLIFANSDDRQKINQLIHPLVMRNFEHWCDSQKSSALFLESAILFEARLEENFDLVIVVDAPLKQRLARVKKRDPQWSEEMIMQRVEAQMDQDIKRERADILILNHKENSKDITYKVNCSL